MKNRISAYGILAAILLAGCLGFFSSCDPKEEKKTEKIVVTNIVLPSTIEIDEGGATITLALRGKTNIDASVDKVILRFGSTDYNCAVTSLREGDALSFFVDESVPAGNCSMYIEHGGAKYLCGSFTLNLIRKLVIEPDGDSTIYGQVTCGGEPVQGVVVSDGRLAVKTDENGIYQLASGKPQPYVFISVPSGYEPLTKGILPNIYTMLSKAANVAERADFELVKVPDQTRHTMLVFGDMHLANRTNDRTQFRNFVKDVNEYTAAHSGDTMYGLTLGDMTWDLYWIDNSYEFKEYLNDANDIDGLAIYHTIGNHDHSMYATGDVSTVVDYKQYISPTYYSFNVGSVHYVVLDDIVCTNATPDGNDKKGNLKYKREYDTKVSSEQIAWLKNDLSFVPTTTPLVVTMHAPLYTDKGSAKLQNATELTNILKAYSEVHVFTAHTHKVYNIDYRSDRNIYEHNAGAVCATWWWSAYETPGVHIAQDGAPGGYTILNVDGTSFKWQYKATGAATDYQFRTYDRNTISLTASKYLPSAGSTYSASFAPSIWGETSTANEVYINLWNYDPSWKIEVTENGKSLEVSRIQQKDPLHLVAYTAKRLNKNATATFATDNNYHMFKVTASGPSTTLEIKVTDCFGNVYTETMKRPKNFTTDAYKF